MMESFILGESHLLCNSFVELVFIPGVDAEVGVNGPQVVKEVDEELVGFKFLFLHGDCGDFAEFEFDEGLVFLGQQI